MKIQTEKKRVYLETMEIGDAEEIACQANDAELSQSVAAAGEFPHPYSIDDAMMFIAGAAEECARGKGYHFGIKMDDGKVIGMAGIRNIDNESHTGEIGFWIGRGYRRHGFATEAVASLITFGFGELVLEKIFAEVLVSNHRSISLLSKLGFASERQGIVRTGTGKVSDTLIMSLARG